jgi:hypothetical protein
MPPPHLDRLIAGSTPPPSQPSDCWLSLPHPHPPPCAQPPPHPPPPAMRARASSRAAPPPPPHDPRTANNLHPPASHPPGLVPLAPALTANNLHQAHDPRAQYAPSPPRAMPPTTCTHNLRWLLQSCSATRASSSPVTNNLGNNAATTSLCIQSSACHPRFRAHHPRFRL